MNITPAFLWQCFIIYIIAINALALMLFFADKYRARHGNWRISEKTLLLTAFFGSSLGALIGMKIFRHKTLHAKFKYGIPLLLLIHIALLLLLIYKTVLIP